ncbi:glycosyltransferase [Lysinibacillus capsici]|uniref:glycosyltransferase n=1 Tax=Lysinibacillus capsici TaxID=2115968 RepID=UPI0028BF3C06|nr:glycosyltransferase [Lysinibacillus capsici]WNN76873.1 glycosyltransferase [Lysinibacillus capsici]WPK06050.1 glycosyltransferase [Lysinibacillus capsici]
MVEKNILIVAEHFSIGGLETHILSQCEVLNEIGGKVFFATSSDSNISLIEKYLTASLLIDEFTNTTGKNIVQQYQLLREFILYHRINYIQIHPHVSAIVVAAVANELNIPYSYTAHGPLNFSPLYGEVYSNLIFDIILPSAHKIYTVSNEIKELIRKNNKSLNIILLPNVIPVKETLNEITASSNTITLISRLDKDKVEGILKFIEFYREYIKTDLGNQKSLVIVGDGNSYKEIENFVKDDNGITLVGYSSDVSKYIDSSYFVCGMGRVVLESMAQNKPILLLGYDGIKGFVSKDNVEHFAESNFSGRNTSIATYESILKEINDLNENSHKYCLHRWTFENRSTQLLKKEYMNIENVNFDKETTKNKWSNYFINVCNDLLDQNILSSHNIIYFLDLLNLNKEDKITMSLWSNLNRVKEEKQLQSMELAMIRQSLHESALQKSEVENRYKELLEVHGTLLKTQKELLDQLANSFSIEEYNQVNHALNQVNEDLNKVNEELNFKNHQIFQLTEQLQFNQQVFNNLSQKIYELHGSKYFKLVNLLKRTSLHLVKGNTKEKKEFIKWFYKKLSRKNYISTNKIDHPLDQLITLIEQRDAHLLPSSIASTTEVKAGFEAMYNQQQMYYKNYLNQQNDEYTKQIKGILKNRKFKGIVIYPTAVHWEPMQRPQQFLREFAKKGYLCFFCAPYDGEFSIKEYEENLFIVNNDAALLSVVRNKYCIVLCTWQGQKAFIDLLPQKLLWYDLLDQLEFFADTDAKTIEAHYQTLEQADIVTYSADKLHKYVSKRADAIILPNASNIADFIQEKDISKKGVVLQGIKNRKVIGYFGAIEEWFEIDLINQLAERNKDWLFVIIGHVGASIKFKKLENIRLIGKVDYNKLVDYASLFDVGIVPFKINDLTDCVSPVKYFEYRALGIPVVTTGIHEMKKFSNDYGVYIADNVTEFENSINEALLLDKDKLQQTSKDFALKHQWKNRIELVEQKMLESISNLKAYANYTIEEHVSVMTGTFLGLDGENFYSGGAERYLIDLNEVVNSLGKNLIIYQYGTFPWTRKFKNIEVRSLARGTEKITELSVENVKNYNKVYYDEEHAISLLNIYSAFFESWPNVASPSIGISHGIAWDSPQNNELSALTFWEQNRRIIESASLVDKMVSVDTNTANWFQTIDFNLGNTMEYVPNYVDTNIFKPVKKESDRIVISYPRRLYGARGLYMVLDIIDEILTKYPHVDFHFVGKGFEEDTKHVEQKISKWKDRIKWYSLDPSEMHKAYEVADISLVPTLHSEGTSLSCLEAMSSGNAVISTRIGGLTDLIINEFNGILIEPNSSALKRAIKELLNNPEKLKFIKENAVQVSKTFSKNQWSKKWSAIVKDFIEVTDKKYELKSHNNIHFYIDDENDLERVLDRIKTYLFEGHNIMIFMKKMISNRERKSFGRLQFLHFSEDIFDAGDYLIASNKISDIMKNYKYQMNEHI